jgi:hypothetical protein
MPENIPLGAHVPGESNWEKERDHLAARLDKKGHSATAACVRSLGDAQYRALDIACARLPYGVSSIADSTLDDAALLAMITPFATPDVGAYATGFRKAIEGTLED